MYQNTYGHSTRFKNFETKNVSVLVPDPGVNPYLKWVCYDQRPFSDSMKKMEFFCESHTTPIGIQWFKVQLWTIFDIFWSESKSCSKLGINLHGSIKSILYFCLKVLDDFVFFVSTPFLPGCEKKKWSDDFWVF